MAVSPKSGLPSDLVAFMLIGFLFSDLKHKSLNSSCSFYCLLDFISLIWNTIPVIAVPVAMHHNLLVSYLSLSLSNGQCPCVLVIIIRCWFLARSCIVQSCEVLPKLDEIRLETKHLLLVDLIIICQTSVAKFCIFGVQFPGLEMVLAYKIENYE